MVKVYFGKAQPFHSKDMECFNKGCKNKVRHLVIKYYDGGQGEQAVTKLCTDCLLDSYREMSEYVLQLAEKGADNA